MLCQHCGLEIGGVHYRAGLNGTDFCSKSCCYEAYKNFYSKQEVNKTMKKIKVAPKRCTASKG
jgi:hypothetical protein